VSLLHLFTGQERHQGYKSTYLQTNLYLGPKLFGGIFERIISANIKMESEKSDVSGYTMMHANMSL
jgi:hypothetical protein